MTNQEIEQMSVDVGKTLQHIRSLNKTGYTYMYTRSGIASSSKTGEADILFDNYLTGLLSLQDGMPDGMKYVEVCILDDGTVYLHYGFKDKENPTAIFTL